MFYKVFKENGDAVWVNTDHIVKIEKPVSKPEYFYLHLDRRKYRDSTANEVMLARPGCDELKELLGES